MHACVYTCVHAYVHACMYESLCGYMHTCTRVCVCAHTLVYACAWACTMEPLIVDSVKQGHSIIVLSTEDAACGP